VRRQMDSGKNVKILFIAIVRTCGAKNPVSIFRARGRCWAIAPNGPTDHLHSPAVCLPTAWAMIRPYWSRRTGGRPGAAPRCRRTKLSDGYISVSLISGTTPSHRTCRPGNNTVFLQQLIPCPGLWAYHSFCVYQIYLNQMLEIRWRRWLTERYLRHGWPRAYTIGCSSSRVKQTIPINACRRRAPAYFPYSRSPHRGLRALVTLVALWRSYGGLSGTLTSLLAGSPLLCLATWCGPPSYMPLLALANSLDRPAACVV